MINYNKVYNILINKPQFRKWILKITLLLYNYTFSFRIFKPKYSRPNTVLTIFGLSIKFVCLEKILNCKILNCLATNILQFYISQKSEYNSEFQCNKYRIKYVLVKQVRNPKIIYLLLTFILQYNFIQHFENHKQFHFYVC